MAQRVSPFIPMFEVFRAELDEHHERRERVIKASRDITAASKKIIFALQRTRTINSPLHPSIVKASAPYWTTIQTQYRNISKDLQGLNAHRYVHNITGGNQEFIEALSFQHYLTTSNLICYAEASDQLAKLGGDGGAIELSPEDYILGLFDMTGELMRFAITSMATSGKLPSSSTVPSGGDDGQKMDVDGSSDDSVTQSNHGDRTVLTDLRALRAQLEALEVENGSRFAADVEKKMGVTVESVEKVEKGLYGLIIRGRERPVGWIPGETGSVEAKVAGRGEPVEGY